MDERHVLVHEGRRKILGYHESGAHAGVGSEERGKAVVQRGMEEPRGPSLTERGQILGGEREGVEGERERLTVEIASAHELVSVEDHRVVRDGVQLTPHDLLAELQTELDGAQDLRKATERVCILTHPGRAG